MQKDHKDIAIMRMLINNKGTVISGDEMAIHLGISRVALWKRIRSLIKGGIPIEVFKRRGYMLVDDMPDSLRAEFVLAELDTEEFGRNYFYFDMVDSTNDVAMRFAEEGMPNGTVVVAESQIAGRGRQNRRWYSPAGKNIYMSVIVRLPITPVFGFRATMMASCALCDTLKSIGMSALIKWPNDIYVRGKKIAGILTEAVIRDVKRVDAFIVGIGLNVNMDKSDMPSDIVDKATSVMLETGGFYPRRKIILALLSNMEKWYRICLNRVEEAWMYWRFNNYTIGRRVIIDGETEAEAIGVTPFGELLVKLGNGRIEKINTQDVEIVG